MHGYSHIGGWYIGGSIKTHTHIRWCCYRLRRSWMLKEKLIYKSDLYARPNFPIIQGLNSARFSVFLSLSFSIFLIHFLCVFFSLILLCVAFTTVSLSYILSLCPSVVSLALSKYITLYIFFVVVVAVRFNVYTFRIHSIYSDCVWTVWVHINCVRSSLCVC